MVLQDMVTAFENEYLDREQKATFRKIKDFYISGEYLEIDNNSLQEKRLKLVEMENAFQCDLANCELIRLYVFIIKQCKLLGSKNYINKNK